MNQTYYYYYATVNNGYSITINGNKASGTTSKLSSTAGGSSDLISHSVWVSYTGSKSITISGTANMSNITASGNTIGTRSVSGTATLDKIGSIPPIPTVSAPTNSTISESATSITISWARSADYSGTATYTLQVSKNSGSYTTIASGIANATTSYSYGITAGQGNTYIFRVCAVNDVGSSDYSYSGTVTTSVISAPTIGTIGTYNPYLSSSLTVPLSGGGTSDGASFKRLANIFVDGYYVWNCTTPSSYNNTSVTIPVDTNQMVSYLGTTSYSNSTRFTIVAWCESVNGTRSAYATKAFTVNINTDGGAAPTITSSIISGGEMGYSSTCFIAGVSSLSVTIGNVTLNRGANSYVSKIDVTGYETVSNTTKKYENLTTGIKTIKVTVTDSRGLSASTSTQVMVQAYALPTIKNAKGSRLTDPNTSATVSYDVYYTPIYSYSNGIDTAGVQLNAINSQEYSVDGGDWATYTSGNTVTGLSSGSTHTISIRVTDKIKTSSYVKASVLIPTIVVPLAFRKSGIGINCIPQAGYNLDVNGVVRIVDSDKNIVMSNGTININTAEGGMGRYGCGSIELYHPTPYINFHYGNSTDDYTARIIESSSGALKVYNSIANASDERLKKDFIDIDDKYKDVLAKVKPCMFRYKKGDDYLHVGFKAQDLDKVFDELGIEDKPIISQDGDDYYALDYSQIASLLWYGWQEQQKEINELKLLIKDGE